MAQRRRRRRGTRAGATGDAGRWIAPAALLLSCALVLVLVLPFASVLLNRTSGPPPGATTLGGRAPRSDAVAKTPRRGGTDPSDPAASETPQRRASEAEAEATVTGGNVFRNPSASAATADGFRGNNQRRKKAPLTAKQKRKHKRQCRKKGKCQYCLTAKLCSAAAARRAAGRAAVDAAGGPCSWNPFRSMTDGQRRELRREGYKAKGGACLDAYTRDNVLAETSSADNDNDGNADADDPTRHPTADPTREPTRDPTADPTRKPTSDPTRGAERSPVRCKTVFQGHCVDS